MPPQQPLTVKDLALMLKEWTLDTIHQEIEKRNQPVSEPEELFGAMLDKAEHDEATQNIRAQRFREALAGMESLLVRQQHIHYRFVLDHVLQNIGALLQAYSMLHPEMGLVNPPQLDYRHLSLFPAMVTPRRSIELPLFTKAMSVVGLNRYWHPQATIHLVEYREWQPRFLNPTLYDDERYGLFAWRRLETRDITFLPLNNVPNGQEIGRQELLILGQRPTFIRRLLTSSHRRQEEVHRLTAHHFTLLLRALLLDYEQLHTVRQRELAEQDQLGTMLWEFLAKE